jgi:hypothetical protein
LVRLLAHSRLDVNSLRLPPVDEGSGMAETGRVRWERLFDDLEGQLAAAQADELAAEVADRLRAAGAGLLALGVVGAGTIEGAVAQLGPDWLLLAGPGRAELLVATDAVQWVTGLGPQALQAPDDPITGRLRLGYALRVVARDRAPVQVVLRDGTVVCGTLDRVGGDFLDVAEHPAGEPRRAANVRRVRTVRLDAVAVVRSV